MSTAEHRSVLLRVFFGWILLALLWRWHDGAMLSQLEAPVLGNAYKDFTFWGFELLGLTNFFTSPGWSLAFDLLLTASVVLALIFPRGVLFPRIYCVAILMYFIVHTTYANHHYRPIIGLVLAGTPFAFRMPRSYTVFQAVRYYVLFIYTSAGLYKIFRGSWVNTDQMTGIIENTQLELLLLHSDGWHAHFFTWLLEHQWASWGLFLLAVWMETVFLIGYFTKRWDLWLFCTAISLHIGFYLTMRFFAFELIVLDLTLLPWDRLFRRAQHRSLALRWWCAKECR
ncbi:MAG: hypothetical protein IPL64_15445 [Flavobacteriales bacterium]|nr:hypothetical protein [Flavobacteriales bacterium]MBK6549803.1 hypothetical protein [Flavobacteriales bacterium]MBK7102321.1 hypothetical protein [Flavobacteriales bacterium]MBK7113059.1 hypothetical protein [Flavobacteriales bacterium]MBK7482944.1 hypothetical protein [Flavobacteriales bacterium]